MDAAVIGGGMAGVLAAHFLKAAGLRTVLLEASRVGGGQTKNTTAKITSQHGLIYHRLIERSGEEPARQYADANQRAVAEYRRMVRELGIDCDFTEAPAYLYSTAEREPLAREFEAAKALGIGAAYGSQTELPFPVAAALRFDGQARFHPLRFLRAVAGPLEIYEGTPVRSVEGNRIFTDRGEVTAAKIVFATPLPVPERCRGCYFMPGCTRSAAMCSRWKTPTKLDGMYLRRRRRGRLVPAQRRGTYLLLGGGNHRTGENRRGGQYRPAAQKRRKTSGPRAGRRPAGRAQDCMTPGRGALYRPVLPPPRPDWYVATGFKKWGMTHLHGRPSSFARPDLQGEKPGVGQVSPPQRFTPAPLPRRFWRTASKPCKGLAQPGSARRRGPRHRGACPAGHGGVVEWGTAKVGVYKDEAGRSFHRSSTRCPHLGCQLEWNAG